MHPNSFGHHISPSNRFAYTFNNVELSAALKDQRISCIVHHGSVPELSTHAVIHSHLEGLSVYASRSAGRAGLSVKEFESILNGQIRNWQQLGGINEQIEIGLRGDNVFLQCSRSILEMHGLNLPAHYCPMSSYGALAEFGRQRRGAILFGLRTRLADSEDLVELMLDGVRVRDVENATYPLSTRVSLILRKSNAESIQLARAFAESLVVSGYEDHMEVEVALLSSSLNEKLQFMESEQMRVHLTA